MPRPWLRLLDPEINDLQHVSARSQVDSLRLARALNARSRHEEAAEVLDLLLAENRRDGEIWFERLLAIGEVPDPEELIPLLEDLEALVAEQPAKAAHLRNLGYLKLILEEDGEADLRRAMELDGQDARTMELLGLLALRHGDPTEARACLLKALTLDPKDARTLRLLGLACEQLDDPRGAESHYTASLDVNPSFFWGWHSLGELFIKQEELVDGLRCIHRARSLMPRELNSYFILAELFSEQGHLEMALAEMHKVVLLAPGRSALAEAFSLMGELRKDMGDADTATSYFTLAAETNPDDPKPWCAMGDFAREEERWEDAQRCYREALARDPEAADIQVQLGYVLMHNGHCAESEKAFLSALEADPGEYSAFLGLAECHRTMGRQDEQHRMVARAMELAPEDPDVWNAYGVALEVRKHPVEATEAYEKALTFAPFHRKAANNLGFLLEKRMAEGEAELKPKAVEAWKRRLLICRDEGQSLKMATEHLEKLGVPSATIENWLQNETGNTL
nr:tetratricopeptide repeat protein [uncultured Holophaga sp.]